MWDAQLAGKAQAHADACKFAHTPSEERQGNGENLYASWGVVYPTKGMDACTSAAYSWYMEVTSYNFSNPSVSKEQDVQIGHFTQMIWSSSTKLGCAWARCKQGLAQTGLSLPADFVVCAYSPGGNVMGVGAASTTLWSKQVKPTRCQSATGDDWCSHCTGAKCTGCYPRFAQGQAMGQHAIRLDVKLSKCVSACIPGQQATTNCDACAADTSCLRCRKRWRLNGKRQCEPVA